ncbi:unnamed protein product [Staurois parvus]|uniref:Uncharacterized protein n=1 Tax=Staurois parvus TaxID=386267 RepID=A0ABN9BSY3_9NEOB|nr:unnamed protein product [Staurois parvus]
MTDLLRCPSCKMTFKSSLLLEKHRDKFCIGADTGRIRGTQTPQDMLNRLKKSRRSKDEHTKETNNFKRPLIDYRFLDSSEKTDFENINGNARLEPAPDNETHLRYLADAHSKQINDILLQNKLLEKQRDDIVQRLNEISAQSQNTSYLEKMIRHLNAQEQKNEQLLSAMKQQIDLLQVESLKRGTISRHSQSPGSRKAEKGPLSLQQLFVPFYGRGTLSSEISALRMTYLQNGGNDQMILAHLQDLLTEAQLIEQKEKHAQSIQKKTKKGHGNVKWHLNEKLITLEIENQQLEDELFKLQLQRQKNNRIPKTTNGDFASNFEKGLQFPRFRKETTSQNIKTLNTELEVLKQEMEIQKLKRRLKTSVHRAKPQMDTVIPLELNKPDSPNLGKVYFTFSHNLEPAPYDPIAGFVVFYDYLLGLDPSYRVCRTVVSLCNGGAGDGKSFSPPSHLL